MDQAEAKAGLKARARKLRNGATEPELRLWRHLRNSQLAGFKFRRQVAIPPFVADFLCPAKSLIVEIDGWTHDPRRDSSRDQLLSMKGYTAIRFTNTEVTQNVEGVVSAILEQLQCIADRWPHPNPSPEGEGL
ncbi:MAG: endonuclease domain-containing protein [Sphingomicrobium sp.]